MGTGKARGAHPWLTPELFAKAQRRAYLYALKLKHTPDEAEDFVQAAFAKALDPDGSPWTPGMTPDFASHICNLLFSAHGNHVQSYAALNVRTELDDGAIERRGHAGEVGAEEALDDTRAARLAEERYELLSERVKDDPLVVLLLDDGDGKSSTDRAVANGHTLDEVELARARLKRHIQAVVRLLPSRADAEENP